MATIKENINKLIEKLKSPNADKVYVAKDYTKKQLIEDLKRIHLE